MRKVILIIMIILFAGAGYVVWSQTQTTKKPSLPAKQTSTQTPQPSASDQPQQTVIAENLDTPWALALLPDGNLLVTERPGRVSWVDSQRQKAPVLIATLDKVKEIGEGGLLGIALHPNFSSNHYVYLYYTYTSTGENTLNRVVRMTYTGTALTDEQVIVDRIPGASNHNGGRIKFGPDNLLYIGTGDAQDSSQAQNTSTLGGKILRVTDEGKAAPGNPFSNQVYSYGHRNVQGLAFDASGALWATEHGRSGAASGFDEVNKIESGKNYGWPIIQGNEIKEGMVTPVYNSGAATTWAPSGAAFIGNSLFFSGLRGQSLYEAVIENGKVTQLKAHLVGTLGRLREVIATPDGLLYITTSNNDSRGIPRANDDKILLINPKKL